MDDVRVGRILRALRRRRGWRQEDLGAQAGCSQTAISLVERGHLADLPLRRLRQIFAALEAEALIDVRWRGGALDRLLDERHAFLVGLTMERLKADGWHVGVEVSYSRYGERGSIDVLAWHEATRGLLVVEVKSELSAIESTLRKLDEKVRLGPAIARERFGWHTSQVSRLLVLPDRMADRDRVARAAAVLVTALPSRTRSVRAWLRDPGGRLDGIALLRDTRVHAAASGRGAPGTRPLARRRSAGGPAASIREREARSRRPSTRVPPDRRPP